MPSPPILSCRPLSAAIIRRTPAFLDFAANVFIRSIPIFFLCADAGADFARHFFREISFFDFADDAIYGAATYFSADYHANCRTRFQPSGDNAALSATTKALLAQPSAIVAFISQFSSSCAAPRRLTALFPLTTVTPLPQAHATGESRHSARDSLTDRLQSLSCLCSPAISSGALARTSANFTANDLVRIALAYYMMALICRHARQRDMVCFLLAISPPQIVTPRLFGLPISRLIYARC